LNRPSHFTGAIEKASVEQISTWERMRILKEIFYDDEGMAIFALLIEGACKTNLELWVVRGMG